MKFTHRIFLGAIIIALFGMVFVVLSFDAISPVHPKKDEAIKNDDRSSGQVVAETFQNAEESSTVMNADHNFAGTNMSSSIYLQWSDLPTGTSQVLFPRGETETGPWVTAINRPEAVESPSTAADAVDGTVRDWYYKLLALDSLGEILKTFAVLRVPKTKE